MCTQHPFLTEFAPMIECILPGIGNIPGKEANETVVIGGVRSRPLSRPVVGLPAFRRC